MNYFIQVERCPASSLPKIRWCLDFPAPNQAATLAQLAEEGIWVQGWFLQPRGQVKGRLVLETDHAKHELPLDRARPDVIQAILHEQADDHHQRDCGFRRQVVLSEHNELCWYQQGRRVLLARLQVTASLAPIQGKAGWLFLDNDTNRSVEQFTGHLLLSDTELAAWDSYLQQLKQLSTDSELKGVQVLLAPTKEAVYSEMYPHPPGEMTPVTQLLDLESSKPLLLYPASLMKSSTERTFRITDTHWSCYGALIAALQLYQALGFEMEAARALFATDRYVERTVMGDLGSKFYPPKWSQEVALKGYSHRRQQVFDNELANFGRIKVVENPKALQPLHCLIFGSSSSYSMLDYVARLFKTVTLIHSAGNVDTDILAALGVDVVVTQTNARFVIRAPVIGYSLKHDVITKFQALPVNMQHKLLTTIKAMRSDDLHPVARQLVHWHQEWLLPSGETL